MSFRIPKCIVIILALMLSIRSFSQDFYFGVDLSYVNELEDCGVKYYNNNNVETDVYDLLSDNGANLVRLRLWYNPEWTNYSNYNDVKKSIARAKASGMKVLLDFHYSEFWADPARQWRPSAWNGITDDAVLGDSLYNYTYNTLNDLAAEGLLPDMVQIGNEINCNILIERTTEKIDDSSPGRYPINWTRQIALLHRGIQAVDKINDEQNDSIKTVIHIAQPENVEWWFADAVSNGLTGFDVIGLSYYPQWSDYNLRELGEHIAKMKKEYNKDVMVVEVGYPWTLSGKDGAGNVLGNDSKMEEYNNIISNDVQSKFLIELTYLIKSNGGIGIIYWEPAWVSSSCETYWATGSHYENATLFDFDNKINSGADFMSYNYDTMPPGLSDKQVTFQVDMTDIETSHGVFVTGSFTGENWSFIPMTLVENNLYETIVTIPGRSIGGYIFYNNNIWNDSFKETVPSSCAIMWDTHRKYIIKDSDAQYAFSWSKCTLETNTSVKSENESKIVIFPSVTRKYLTVNADDAIKSVQAINIQGQKFDLNYSGKEPVDVRSLNSGMYVLAVQTEKNYRLLRFIKH